MADSQQVDFNAGMVELARAFQLSPDQALQIQASAHRALDLKNAMVVHLWTAKLAALRAKMSCVVMPIWIKPMIGEAWNDCGGEFIAIAETELARASQQVAV